MADWRQNIELPEMAKKLGMETDELVTLLREQGLMDGNTQSALARRMKLFQVKQGVVRCSGGLYHKTKLQIEVRPKGQVFLWKHFGPAI